MERRPTLAVFKLASCDGCQLALLDCEDELLEVAGAVSIENFLEASSAVGKGPYDLVLVEGSVTTPHDAERIHRVRRQARFLVALGACATGGGIQALRNSADVAGWARSIYADPSAFEVLGKSTPVRDHVPVDFELRGCPVRKEQLLEVVSALLAGRRPQVPSYSVCIECKRRGTPCVMVARSLPCLGPVTQAGCGAICPSYHRGCYACFGPMEAPNTASLAALWSGLGAGEPDVARSFRSFHAADDAFRRESEAHGQG